MVEKYGRKFSITIIAMLFGFTLAVVGLVLVQFQPAESSAIVSIVTSFATVLTIITTAYSGAQGAVDWRHGPSDRTTQTTTDTHTSTQTATAPRPSGSVLEPPTGV